MAVVRAVKYMYIHVLVLVQFLDYRDHTAVMSSAKIKAIGYLNVYAHAYSVHPSLPQLQLADEQSTVRALRRQQVKTLDDQHRIGDDLSR